MKKVLIIAAAIAGLGFAVAGCAQLGPVFSNPQNDLAAVEAGISGLEAMYASTCQAGALQAICTPADQAQAAQLEQAISSAISVAQSAINVYNGASSGTAPTAAQLAQDIQGVASAVQGFSNFVNGLTAKKAMVLKASLSRS